MSASVPPRRRKKRGPGRPPRSESRHTRTEIINAAEKLFAAHGYHGTSLRQIAKSSHVDLATIKYHYADKEALYDEAFIRGHQRIVERFMPEVQALSEAQTPEVLHAALLRLTEHSARLILQDEVFLRMLFFRSLEGIPYSDEIVELYFKDITQKITDALTGPIERKLIRAIDADSFAMLLFASIPAMSLTSKAYHSFGQQTEVKRALSLDDVETLAKELMGTLVLYDNADSEGRADADKPPKICALA